MKYEISIKDYDKIVIDSIDTIEVHNNVSRKPLNL